MVVNGERRRRPWGGIVKWMSGIGRDKERMKEICRKEMGTKGGSHPYRLARYEFMSSSCQLRKGSRWEDQDGRFRTGCFN